MALSKINPTKLSSWKKLFQQFNKENNYHINDFFNALRATILDLFNSTIC